MNKNAIASAFTKYASSYPEVDSVQKKTAEQLIEYLVPLCPSPVDILDIGTGRGNLLPFLRFHYPHAQIYCNDISQGMLSYIDTHAYNIVELLCGDAETMLLPYTSLYISNFVFQWFQNSFKTIEKLSRQCTYFAFTTLLQDTFQEWKKLCKDYGVEHKSYSYPSKEDMQHYLNRTFLDHNIFYKEHYYPLSFENPLVFMKYVKKLGASTPSHQHIQYRRALYLNKMPFNTHYHVAFVIIYPR